MAVVSPDSTAPGVAAAEWRWAVAMADMVGMPIVIPTCWLIVAMPVANLAYTAEPGSPAASALALLRTRERVASPKIPVP
jgi:hypothetical protein